MHQIQRGAGRKLLLIHGLGGSWQSWSTILDALSAHRTVIAVDLPGHGATPADTDSDTFVGLVGSVVAGAIVWALTSSNMGMLATLLIGCGGAALAIAAQRGLRRSAILGT